MNYQEVVSFSERLHEIAGKSADLLGNDLETFVRMNGIDKPEALKRTFEELENANRLMNVGILGRVKAGKSSLLNALIFNGEEVLPKAATPMTAALTTITYGKSFSAQVEFYSEADCAGIEANAIRYKQELERRREVLLEGFLQRSRQGQREGAPDSNTAEVSEMATKKATLELQREKPGLAAAHDQYERMKKSGLSLQAIKDHSYIDADSPKALAGKLIEYVGAQGRYMPFTKIVHIFMPLEALRDIRVIDTPGLNDPVQSREERTVDLLKSCDVVFIVSPAGQFLNEQDLELMGRVTRKEGVQELVLVASQVDTQLYGSEKRAQLSEALNSIRGHLAERAVSVLTALNRDSLGFGAVFDGLIESARSNILHSSGLCHGLRMKFNDADSWDANERVAWDNLCRHYPDYFDKQNPELSGKSLEMLSNISVIQGVLAQVRDRKDEITREKVHALLTSKQAALDKFKKHIADLAKSQVAQIRSTSIEELDSQIQNLEAQKLNLANVVDFAYEGCVHEYEQGLWDSLHGALKRRLDVSKDGIEEAESTGSRSVTEKKSGLLNKLARGFGVGGYREYKETFTKIATGQVKSAIKDFVDQVDAALSDSVVELRRNLDNKLSRTITPGITSVLGAGGNPALIVSSIRSVVAKLPNAEFELGVSLPSELNSKGTIKGHEADIYKEAAEDFLYELDRKAKSKIKMFVKSVKEAMPKTISDSFAKELHEKIEKLKSQINNSAQAIERLERISRQVEGVVL